MNENIWTITSEEIALTDRILGFCLKSGASAARIVLNKSMMDLVMLLDGETDKVTHTGDRSLTFNLFADGRYGTFSTNRLEESELQSFALKALDMVALMEPDGCRRLPDPARTIKNAVTGKEAGLFDEEYGSLDAAGRFAIASSAAVTGKKDLYPASETEYELVSEETEYSDSIFDCYTVDSNGLKARHIETAYEIGTEITIQTPDGERYTNYWWDSVPRLKDFHPEKIGLTALHKAVKQIGPVTIKPGKRNVVVASEVAGKLLNPVIQALNGFALQQKNSFLDGTLGKRIFPAGLDIWDLPLEQGKNGAKLFDSEGVALKNTPIIEDGVVKQYFINTYIAAKMGTEPTTESRTRACVKPWISDDALKSSVLNSEASGIDKAEAKELVLKDLNLEKILRICKDGILITGFNGGNSNTATGAFSYGAEGFEFKDGKIVNPVRGLVVTGNFIKLWNNLIAAGSDPRPCANNQIPTLAFSDTDISA